MSTKKAKKTPEKFKSNPLFSIYGARKSKSGKRINISILTGPSDAIEWGTISLDPNKKNGAVKIKKITDIDVTIVVPRVDIVDEDDEDEEDDEEDED